jgi:lipoyl(octanoyl) transferase
VPDQIRAPALEGILNSTFLYRPNYGYEQALALQGVLSSEGYTGLLAFETPETITLGRASDHEQEVLVSPEFLRERNIQLLSTDRGGKSSYHGPGQLVGFPIANLNELYGDPRAVKRFSEELLLGLAHACAVLGVKSVSTRPDFPGVWTNRGMLASVGIAVKDGFVFHGFSVNVSHTCLSGFSLIHPCGLQSCPVTTLEQEGVVMGSVSELATRILPYLSVIQGEEVLRQSKTVSYESTYANLVSTVSRSQMAIDHFRSNLESIRNGE